MRIKFVISVPLMMLVAACSHPADTQTIINQKASVPAAFHLQNLRVIASSINKKRQTMSTLYGNSKAINRARSGGLVGVGEELMLITWRQKADENWFGANIPANVVAVEKIVTGNDPLAVNYQRYEGPALTLATDTSGQHRRIIAIFGQKDSILP
ncbi:MAG: hypothetical protein JWP37_2006 [Mucilaginibacter sp.]|nr:hypothetical protein [Mucilaginibacter sp.]